MEIKRDNEFIEYGKLNGQLIRIEAYRRKSNIVVEVISAVLIAAGIYGFCVFL